jgi:toxin ParE1/3/4
LLRFHPSVGFEVEGIGGWYRDANPRAAESFYRELRNVLSQIPEHPERFPVVRPGVRRAMLRTFPYKVIFRPADNIVEVVAVAHVRRRPDYWLARL